MRITTFASGSSGNCTLITIDGSHYLIDAGISYRRICENLALSGLMRLDVTAVLITHEHRDHIAGLQTMAKHSDIPIYAPEKVARRIVARIPSLAGAVRILPVGESVPLGKATVRAFHTPHDTPESVGYRLEGDDGVFAFATDMGRVTEEICSGLLGADVALIEANHDVELLRYGPYPYELQERILSDRGHLSNADSAALAVRLAESGTKYILLGHLSETNNTPDLAYQTVHDALGAWDGELYVIPADRRLTVEPDTLCTI